MTTYIIILAVIYTVWFIAYIAKKVVKIARAKKAWLVALKVHRLQGARKAELQNRFNGVTQAEVDAMCDELDKLG